MICLSILFSVAILLWLAYLLRRSFMPRISGQIGVYRRIAPTGIVVVALVDAFFLGFSIAAALNGVWIAAVPFLGLAAVYAWLITRPGLLIVAYSEAALTLRGLSGPAETFRWADVSSCTIRTEIIGGRHRFPMDFYYLTLPGRTIEIPGGTDAGIQLLQVFERQRPDLRTRPARRG